MTAEQNKELATRTLTSLLKGDVDATLANMSDEISWVVPGNLPVSGLKKGKAAVAGFVKGVKQGFPGGLVPEMRKVHADGDTVIVELTNRGKAHNGKDYENEYCFIFEIEGGKIRRMREYVDTQRVKDILFS